MTLNVYAKRSDVYKYGLPRGTLGMPARIAASALASTDTIELDGHGFETDDPVLVTIAEGGTMPAPLVAGTTYYVIRLSDSTFQLATAPAGSAINLTTDGVDVKIAAPLPFDEVLEFYSRWADGFLPAHLVPLLPDADTNYPPIVRGVVAELASKKLQLLAGHSSEAVGQYEIAAKAQLERWSKGVPLRDSAEGAANQSIASSLVITGTDSRGWGSRLLP